MVFKLKFRDSTAKCKSLCPLQAIARIYRIGQNRSTFVYRLMYKNTMEEAVYRLSVDKEVSLCCLDLAVTVLHFLGHDWLSNTAWAICLNHPNCRLN